MPHTKFLHATCWAILIALSATIVVHAHGTIVYPQSRSWLCFQEGPESPKTAACQEAVRVSGTQHLYDWDSVNQLPDGNHQSVIQDGQLCNGGRAGYAGINLPREDWTKTSLIPDENGQTTMVYNASAPHSTDYWRFYVTKDGWDPLETLSWSDLEEEPFCEYGDVPLVGEENYVFDCPVPIDKEGYHIVYLIWQRNDSTEAFYSCSDVLLGTAAELAESEPPAEMLPPVAGECRSTVYNNIVTYREGDLATFEGQEWEAKWWVKGVEPGNDPAWILVAEDCAVAVTVTPVPTVIPTTPSDTGTSVTPDATSTSVPTTPVPADTSTPEPIATPLPTPTEPPTEPVGSPLNVGYSAGSNPSPNNIFLLFTIAVGLGLLGTIRVIVGRKH